MNNADLELIVEHMKTSIPEDAVNPWCNFLDRISDLEVSIQTMTDQLSAGEGSPSWRHRCEFALQRAKRRLASVMRALGRYSDNCLEEARLRANQARSEFLASQERERAAQKLLRSAELQAKWACDRAIIETRRAEQAALRLQNMKLTKQTQTEARAAKQERTKLAYQMDTLMLKELCSIVKDLLPADKYQQLMVLAESRALDAQTKLKLQHETDEADKD